MTPRPVFARAEAVLRYDALNVGRVGEAVKDAPPPPTALVPNWAMSALPHRLVLLSPTGSSAAVIQGEQCTLQTRYFDAFAQLTATQRRRAYMAEKLEALFEVLRPGGFSPMFCGVVSTIRIEAATGVEEMELRKLVSRAAVIRDSQLSPEWQDFQHRISSPIDGLYFENVQVAWYEERVLTAVATPEMPAKLRFREWEIPVTGQGIEVRIDMNNKLGLINGRTDWTREDFLKLVQRYFDEIERLSRKAFSILGLKEIHAD